MRQSAIIAIAALLGAACAMHHQPPEGAETPIVNDLSIARLFDEPNLSGPAPANLKIAPDGSRIGFLRGSDADRLRYDLWEFDLGGGAPRLLVRAEAISGPDEVVSDEEMARRERQRTASLKGIVDYHFSPDGATILFPLANDLYLYDLAARSTRRLTSSSGAEIDPKFSPDGRYVSFVRDDDLHVIELDSGRETALTSNGDGVISNGTAEFIAQEEMDRDTGYWWAPDGSAIAYLQTDQSDVQIVQRFEIHAAETRIIEQRYPSTGTANVSYRLGTVTPLERQTRWLDLGTDDDIYIARVDWFPDSKALAVQRQSRDQQTLELLRIDTATGSVATLLTETSETWIDLFDDLAFLADRQQFVWSSARDGYKHLYLYDFNGRLIRQLTAGEWEVSGNGDKRALLHVDEQSGDYFFVATRQSPVERHLYKASLNHTRVTEPARITEAAGWHEISFSNDGRFYIDMHSSTLKPPSASVHQPDGTLIGYIEENRLDETHPYFPYLEDHAAAEFGVLASVDGQTLHYYLRRPAQAASSARPAIVLVYGGPHGQRVKNQWSDLFEQVLVRHGYVVFSLDNRGTDFRGTRFDAPIYRKLGQAEIVDQKTGVEHLGSLPFVDADRIGIFGWSYGGYMALMCMLQTPQFYAAGVSGAPVTDWRLYDTHYTERYLSTPASNPEGYQQGSVFPYVDRLDSPLLLMHGMADDNVLFSHATMLMRALQQQGRLFELMTYPGSKHGLLRTRTDGMHAYRTILEFFDRHLKR